MSESTKIFINNVNTYVGKTLVEIFKTDNTDDEENQTHIMGTMKNNNIPKPKFVKRILTKEKLSKFKSDILSCQIILFDINDGDYDDLNFILLTLKNAKLSMLGHEIVVVIISSIFTWALTPLKNREPNEEETSKANQEKERLETIRDKEITRIKNLLKEKKDQLINEGNLAEDKIEIAIQKITKSNP